jgi:uncharacterized protein YhfF
MRATAARRWKFARSLQVADAVDDAVNVGTKCDSTSKFQMSGLAVRGLAQQLRARTLTH